MAGALFDQVHEHHKAVHLLLKNSFNGSALSLVRPMFETFVRGFWLRRCAPDQAIEKFKKDKLELKFELLIDEIEKQPDYRRAVLSKIKKQAWKTMCSYAHGGFHQAVNRLTSGFIQPRYAEGAKVEVVNFSSAVALLSAAENFFNGKTPRSNGAGPGASTPYTFGFTLVNPFGSIGHASHTSTNSLGCLLIAPP
jgi:hypothetical protein